jgi:hypothetical protein
MDTEMKSAFDKIMAGLDDAIAYAKGDKKRAREAVSKMKKSDLGSLERGKAEAEAYLSGARAGYVVHEPANEESRVSVRPRRRPRPQTH